MFKVIAEAASSSTTEYVSHQRAGRGESVTSGQLRFRVNVLVTSISLDWFVSIHTLRKGESLHRPPNSPQNVARLCIGPEPAGDSRSLDKAAFCRIRLLSSPLRSHSGVWGAQRLNRSEWPSDPVTSWWWGGRTAYLPDSCEAALPTCTDIWLEAKDHSFCSLFGLPGVP